MDEIVDFYKRHTILITSVIGSGLGLLGIRRYFGGGVCYSRNKLNGKTALITGANSGIGLETAKDLAGRGARIILACRDMAKAEEALQIIKKQTGNDNVLVKKLDLASLSSVRTLAEDIIATEARLDILINNAGVMACPEWKSEEGYEVQFAVNHLGHFLLTNMLLDLLGKTDNGRVVTVSSLAHKDGKIYLDNVNLEGRYHPWKAYAQSKLANILFTKELHKQLEGTTTTAYCLHPGVVRTELLRYVPERRSRVKWFFAQPFVWLFFKSPSQGAQTSIYCAVESGVEKHSGKYFSDCQVKEPYPRAKDDEMAAALWELSAKMVEQGKSKL